MEIFEKISKILSELSGIEEIKPENDLKEDLALDSLSMITLLLEIEETFEIELDESDMNPFDLNTVEDAVKLVEKYGPLNRRGKSVLKKLKVKK